MATLRPKLTWSDLGPELKARLSKPTFHDNGQEMPAYGSRNACTRDSAVDRQPATKSTPQIPAKV